MDTVITCRSYFSFRGSGLSLPQPTQQVSGYDPPLPIALLQRGSDSRWGNRTWILLDDFHLTVRHFADHCDVAVWVEGSAIPYHEIATLRRSSAYTIGELDQVSRLVALSTCQVLTKEVLGVSVAIGHLVMVMLIVVSLGKFHTLVFQSEVIPIGRQVSSARMTYKSVVIYVYSVEGVDRIANARISLKGDAGRHNSPACTGQNDE